MKLIGGQKLRELGNDRHTDDEDYLINDPTGNELFIREPGRDIINAAAHPFYSEVWALDADSNDVSIQALIEMTVFTLVQHCENGQWDKANAKEYDLKFLIRLNGGSANYEIAKKHVSAGAIEEIDKIIASVKI